MECTVKNRLKEILDERGIKTTWLAEKTEVSYKTLSNLLHNRYSTSLEVAFRIAIILNVKVDDIFYVEK